jgi:signal transduction histidine kinase
MELDIMLPLKVAGCLILTVFVQGIQWTDVVRGLEIPSEVVLSFFGLYTLANVVLAALLFASQKLPLAVVRWAAIGSSLVDGVFLAGLTMLTGGYDSIVFWLFFALIIRNAISVPQGAKQHSLNLAISILYAAAAIIGTSLWSGVDENTRRAMGITPAEEVGEPLFARMMVLWLTAACCHAVQMMLERQRHAAEEVREFATRESQLRSAGRLAAQIAHQIKNPLGIINNAAFTLRRVLKDAKPETVQQVEIIREEVARADQIITQLMGYAQLTEGRVERLKVTEELDRAVEEVFPPGIETGIKVHRDYTGQFPPLLMQRRHVSEALTNLLQNAREALNGSGNIFVKAVCHSDFSIEVTIRDDGPGIPSDKFERIFEAYYTTKERGTGLGLAIVKQNMELYGGAVHIESKLGKGARFTLLFPAKTLMRLGK